jgi:thiol-disulfide isomerase/thioredoxin
MKKLPLLILIILSNNLFAQEKLTIGEKAPKINITDYVLNVPKDRNLNNKFIVLEFWATWCAPCLKAVPHLNELQNKYKKRKDLMFLSITNEKPEKIKRTIDKVKFETIVVCDESKETDKNFKITGIPQTILIDNKGVLKWIGHPMDLNEEIINNLLKGKEIINNPKEDVIVESSDVTFEKSIEESKVDEMFQDFLKDKATSFKFILDPADKSDSKMEIDMISRGVFVSTNVDLNTILSKITNKQPSHIILSEELDSKKFNLFYKNKSLNDIDSHYKSIKENLLQNLNLIEKIDKRKFEAFELRLIDKTKLQFSEKDINESHNSNDDNLFTISNLPIKILIKELIYNYKINVFDETGIKENLDFLIKIENIDSLKKQLLDYGLELKEVTKEVDFLIFSN